MLNKARRHEGTKAPREKQTGGCRPFGVFFPLRASVPPCLRALFCLPCLCALLFLASGCQQPNAILRTPYYGPTLTLSQLIAAVNVNNQKLPTLWASHYYEATIVDEKKQSHFVSGDGAFLYRSPDDLRLIGSMELVGTVFDLGSNTNEYWLKVIPQVDTLWYGRYADLNKAALTAQQVPIEPDMILQVLGIEPIDPDLNDLPAPTLRFNNESDWYMVVWNVKLPDRWVAQREIWYDRKTLLPLFVFLYDANGRVVLRARLTYHHPVEVAGMPKANWPVVPGRYSLFFPESGSKMELTLNQVMLKKGEGARAVPNDRTFKAPDPANAGVSHIVIIR
jgi:hypothetical protein